MDFNSDSTFRIIFEGRENYRVLTQDFKVVQASMSGNLRNKSEVWPAVGDWVSGRFQQGEWVLIEEIFARSSVLHRKDPSRGSPQLLAANVDTIFIVTSANQDLNFNRLDRYLAIANSGNVRPVVVVNKIELAEDPRELLDSIAERFQGIDIHGVSCHENWNIEALDIYAEKGQTLAFLGSSGVGKSSLTNALLGEAQVLTSEIRDSDGRGRHTTTHRELHVTPRGAFVIDTPGIRQIGLTDEMELGGTFADVEELGVKCKFTDCKHDSEPHCAIQEALKDGCLEFDRWQNYLKLQREIAFQRKKVNKALRSQGEKKWAKVRLNNRIRNKLRGR